MYKTKKYFAFYLISFLTLFILLELVLNLLAIISTEVALVVSPLPTPVIEDSTLIHRPNPQYPGHDEKGFRNVSLPDETDIVAFGDSQTYGTGINASEAWPQRLGVLSEKTTYSMAYGGYCPVHSLSLWKEALELSPKIIIEGLYTGNDLFDAFDIVYNQQTLISLKTKDSLLMRKIQLMEQEAPIRESVVTLFEKGKNDTQDSAPLKLFLSKYSRIYGLLKSLKKALIHNNKTKYKTGKWRQEKSNAQKQPQHYQILETDQFKTIFTSTYRRIALDTTDIRIKEGLHLALSAIDKMNILAQKKGLHFIVLGIPTKEFVFRPFLDSLQTDFKETTDLELIIWEESKNYLKTKNILFIDGLKPLRKQLELGKQPYHQSKDGHLNQLGHDVIAREVMCFLDSLQLTHSHNHHVF